MAENIDDAVAFLTRAQDGQSDNTCAQWAITLKGDDACIGVIGLLADRSAASSR